MKILMNLLPATITLTAPHYGIATIVLHDGEVSKEKVQSVKTVESDHVLEC